MSFSLIGLTINWLVRVELNVEPDAFNIILLLCWVELGVMLPIAIECLTVSNFVKFSVEP